MNGSAEKIKRIAISCSVEYCGFKYYEIRHFFDRDEGGESFLTTEIPFSVFKSMGVTKRFNGTKKINDWLATEEGRKWYIAGLNKKWGSEHYA
ncbi:hypothetical protein [Brevibacillus borstelensis]|uniref:hypothetical protein n=1 Tax=Brevibacillus borstelensis TaxID=45462 RepID=UPI0004F3D498|nr:hypothetical protein [Brevibacillus borstelensis]KKX53811.1 hypothetical protein X546_17830 [Brevibacillus borstelensis cifa_chp40]